MAFLKLLNRRELSLPPVSLLSNTLRYERGHTLSLSEVKQVVVPNVGATSKTISCLGISPSDGNWLLCGGVNGIIHLFSLVPRSCVLDRQHIGAIRSLKRGLADAHTTTVTSLAWYPRDPGLFVSAGLDAFVKVWDTQRMQMASEFDFTGGIVASVAMSPCASSHTLVAAAVEDTVRLCDLSSHAYTHSLVGHDGALVEVAWSPYSETLVATSGFDGTVRLWDIRQSGGGALTCLDLERVSQAGGANAEQLAKGLNFGLTGGVRDDDGDGDLTAPPPKRVRAAQGSALHASPSGGTPVRQPSTSIQRAVAAQRVRRQEYRARRAGGLPQGVVGRTGQGAHGWNPAVHEASTIRARVARVASALPVGMRPSESAGVSRRAARPQGMGSYTPTSVAMSMGQRERRGGPAGGLGMPRTRPAPLTSQRRTTGLHRMAVAHRGVVFGMCFAPSGRSLITYGNDGAMRVWDSHTYCNELIHVPVPQVSALAQRALAPAQPLMGQRLAVSCDSQVVYLTAGAEILACDLATSRRFASLRGHFDRVHAVCCAPSYRGKGAVGQMGDELYSGGADGKVLVWSPAMDNHTAVARGQLDQIHRVLHTVPPGPSHPQINGPGEHVHVLSVPRAAESGSTPSRVPNHPGPSLALVRRVMPTSSMQRLSHAPLPHDGQTAGIGMLSGLGQLSYSQKSMQGWFGRDWEARKRALGEANHGLEGAEDDVDAWSSSDDDA